MNEGFSLKTVVASALTSCHHIGSQVYTVYPLNSKIHPRPAEAYHCKGGPICLYRQHIKVPKHCVYIQYGCGVQSEDCCSLSFDISMTSHRLTPGLQSSTHKIPKSNPTCRGVSLQRWTHMHRQHIKVPKHFVYIQYGYGIQSEACCGLHFDTMTSLLGSGLPPKTPKLHPRPAEAHHCKGGPISPYTAYQGAKTLCIHPIWMWDPV